MTISAMPTPPFVPQIRLFQQWLTEHRQLQFDDYQAMWRWSVSDIEAFWQSAWDYLDLQSPTPHTAVLERNTMPGARWFVGAKVNYAQQVFRHVEAAHAAGMMAVMVPDLLQPTDEMHDKCALIVADLHLVRALIEAQA